MPFDSHLPARTAIIGAGISGLTAAYELSKTRRVTLIEAAPRLGGHARTVLAGRTGQVPVDTGFIVFNKPNYPVMNRVFDDLAVPTKPSDMSFTVTADNGAFEYGLRNLRAMFAQKRHLVHPTFLRMIRDILHFNKHALSAAQDPDMPLRELLDTLGMGDWFRQRYLLPFSGAIWSSTPEQMLEFPARSLVEFFRNHALLGTVNHKWHTVDGGSIEYVRRMRDAIIGNGSEVRISAPVQGVRRRLGGVQIRCKGAEWEGFNDVVFATHADMSLSLLTDATSDERRVLGGFSFQDNVATLHCDPSQMPRRKACWASWVFRSTTGVAEPVISMTYWMNLLQGIDHSDPIFLSLNSADAIRDEAIYDTTVFRHPIFNHAAMQAQRQLPTLQGVQNTWHCGAYTRWGFHEDGCASGAAVADDLGQSARRVAA